MMTDGVSLAGSSPKAPASRAPASKAPVRDRRRDRALIRVWLGAVIVMIVAMIVVGGATRLTNSGLSITEWKPIHGVIPPLNLAEWQEEFAKYQQIPQYEMLNKGMTLDAFKSIFWWEWGHRLLGRLIGVVFFVPFVLLWLTGRIERKLVPPLLGLFVLGGLQGAVGWWMVASGLVNRVDVSQYRLATHLLLACFILAATVWIRRGLAADDGEDRVASLPLKGMATALIVIVFLQIFLGGLVAGLDAGFTYNTWPLMDGAIIPARVYDYDPIWRSVFEDVMTVQFDHRMVAYLLLIGSFVHAYQAWKLVRRSRAARRARHLAALVLVQAGIGVSTLLTVVPIDLALLHQFGAAVVLIAAVSHRRALSPPIPIES
ncbi:COX15/CtaA family protein [Kaistia dalseonensis]|uniref:Heme A synthase n=1 Tax=Kaistia dalseonensis TaxID=410840 RepID=A0ABU0H1M4_9HYPH|nr:COX15/CtaA family protein [Kaistia dalseonensis]MCX5493646.1 COX15/CtaA family protein [Kaistia dalseonensis]MDQ0436208.1 cytochrome c oxidase assembly protein subunit 15 [Kaistia dalseonensis]